MYINIVCQVLMKPSNYSTRIRLVVASWILNDEIQISQVIDWDQLEKYFAKRKPSLKIMHKN